MKRRSSVLRGRSAIVPAVVFSAAIGAAVIPTVVGCGAKID